MFITNKDSKIVKKVVMLKLFIMVYIQCLKAR
ncbi:hypothetical protein C21_02116 [Arenibacter sp. NBRC 103722]|nr:hypothetical protein C21_02116 [Arenibacter sp. NBRC 103722]